MGYYVTMTHDNVEEVVRNYFTDDLAKVHELVVNEFGSMTFTPNESGSIKAIPLSKPDVFYTIVKMKTGREFLAELRQIEE